MKLKYFLFALLSLFAAGLSGCGTTGGDGLNGKITLATPTVSGSVITARAAYTNPTQTNLIGVAITFTVQIGNTKPLSVTKHASNDGTALVVFNDLPSFSGTDTIIVTAKSDNLFDTQVLNISGTTLAVTSPPSLNASTALPAGTPITLPIPPTATFVTITDPFHPNQLSGHTITIQAAFVSSNIGDNLTQPNPTTTGSAGTAPFPGTSVTLIAPAVGAVDTMTITWTVTDTVTNQTGTALTTITLGRTS